MATKVYLFQYGYDDDRKIGGVFSTRAAAEAAARFGGEWCDVTELEVDPSLPNAPPGKSLWQRYYCITNPEYTGHRRACLRTEKEFLSVRSAHVRKQEGSPDGMRTFSWEARRYR